jgi:signal peptidase
LGVVVIVGVLVGVGWAMGYRAYVVESGSMTPTIGVHSLVISRSIAPVNALAGEVVTFSDPGLNGSLVSHRVLSRHLLPGSNIFSFTTKGDANKVPEQWEVPAKATVGKVVAVVPKVGDVIGPLSSALGRGVLIGVFLMLCLFLFASRQLQSAKVIRAAQHASRRSTFPPVKAVPYVTAELDNRIRNGES